MPKALARGEFATTIEHVHGARVSDYTFVTWVVAAATFVAVVAMAYRWIAFGGRRWEGAHVDAELAAFLAGGSRLAVFAALGGLRGAGAVAVSPDRALTLTAPLPVDATRLARAVYDATAGGPTGAQLPGHPAVSATLARLRDDLERDGLLLSRSQRARTHWFVYAQLAVVAAGLVRVAVDLVNRTPIGDLVSALVLIGIFLLFMAAVPTRTRAGTAVLAELRRQHADLTPSRKKASRRAYGPGAAEMAIALFGLRSLYALDPVFASDVGAPLPRRTVSFGA